MSRAAAENAECGLFLCEFADQFTLDSWYVFDLKGILAHLHEYVLSSALCAPGWAASGSISVFRLERQGLARSAAEHDRDATIGHSGRNEAVGDQL